MTTFQRVNEILSEINTILVRANQYNPMVYRILRSLAEEQGWIENTKQGKGDHRSFCRNGYPPIIVDCPGEGSELHSKSVQEALRNIYQPAVDQLLAALSQTVQLGREQWLQEIVQAVEAVSVRAVEMAFSEDHVRQLIEAEAETAKQELREVRKRIQHFETEGLEQAQRTLAELAEEQLTGAQKAIIERTKSELTQSEEQTIELHQQLCNLQYQLDFQSRIEREKDLQLKKMQSDLDYTNQVFAQLEKQEQNAQSRLRELQMTTQALNVELQQEQDKRRSLEQSFQELETKWEQERKHFSHYRRQQKMKDIVTLIGMGLALVLGIASIRTLLSATEPVVFHQIPLSQPNAD